LWRILNGLASGENFLCCAAAERPGKHARRAVGVFYCSREERLFVNDGARWPATGDIMFECVYISARMNVLPSARPGGVFKIFRVMNK
jgi:hypothetical protein